MTDWSERRINICFGSQQDGSQSGQSSTVSSASPCTVYGSLPKLLYRDQRVCKCEKCTDGGRLPFKSVSQDTWRRHNPPEQAARVKPAVTYSSQLQPFLGNPSASRGSSRNDPTNSLEYPHDPSVILNNDSLHGENDDGSYTTNPGPQYIPDYVDHVASDYGESAEPFDGFDRFAEQDDDIRGTPALTDDDSQTVSDGTVNLPPLPPFYDDPQYEYHRSGLPILDTEAMTKHHNLSAAQRHTYTAIAFFKLAGMTDRTSQVLLDQMTAGTGVALEEAEHMMAEADMEQRPLGLDDMPDNEPVDHRTAMSRLGVNPDQWIKQYISCGRCFTLVPLEQLYSLPGPECQQSTGDETVCGTPLYSNINHVRTPFRVAPYNKLSNAIAMLLQDPEIRESLQEWRDLSEDGSDDILPDGDDEPLDKRVPYLSRHQPMTGITQGSAWRAMTVNSERMVWDDDRGHIQVEDCSPNDYLVYRLVNSRFGLNIIINVDW